MKVDVQNIINSLKGISGSGTVLSKVVERATDILHTLEPGDIAGQEKASAAPVATDLWYLWYHQNLMQKYYADVTGADFKHYNYSAYISANLSFLSYLPGLKPLKVFTDLKTQLTQTQAGQYGVFGDVITSAKYNHNGIYWINTVFFELRIKDTSLQYSSEGSKGFKTNPNDYVGYLAFPIGQLGVMEVISIFQETELRGYKFTKVDSLTTYHKKDPIADLEDQYKPSLQSTPEMFPDMKDSKGNQLAGKNYCFGRHLIDYAYYKPETPSSQQNNNNSDGNSAYAPVADRDVELWASDIKDYGEDIKPKKWMRYWIHKDSTLPVPGEFIGILVRPVAAPPHVWWFQESSPLLYAGNWMETGNLTSGIVTEVTLEADRTDGGTGDLYKVKIQGCEIQIAASDYLRYNVGDRVAVLKTENLTTADKAFASLNQTYLKDSDSYTKTLVINTKYVIIPATFYKIKH
jgi:hypothetical protein